VENTHGNLPAEVTTFVGRRDAVAQVRSLLTSARLLTLTGPGGVGKTRLATHVGRALERGSPGGVWLIECAELRDPELLADHMATSLALTGRGAASAEAAVLAHLSERDMLLILDNCEHLIGACARLTAEILRAAPHVRILATSRESLGVPGEYIYPVSPFPVTDGGGPGEAVELFEQRAAAAVPGFRVDATLEPTIVALCERLDGMPLAIELAAVRIRALSPQRIIERLDDDLSVLASRLHGRTARHQTLRAAIDWSYDLCSVDERTLWARLSVFSGSFDLAAAIAVCPDEDLSAAAVEDTLVSLVGKSVVLHDVRRGHDRYRLLETLRQYGRERLRDDQERRHRDRHRDHFLDVAERAAAQWSQPTGAGQPPSVDEDLANLRAALGHNFADPGASVAGLRLASALWFVWIRGAAREGGYWLDRAIAAATGESAELGRALWRRAWIAAAQGDASTARASLSRAEEIADRLDDDMRAHVRQASGAAAIVEGDTRRAAAEFGLAVRYFRTAGDWTFGHLLALVQLGWMQAQLGDVDTAIATCEECRSRSAAAGNQWALAWAHCALGAVAWTTGDQQTARARLRDSLKMWRESPDWMGIAVAIEHLAWTEPRLGSAERGARLLGATEALWQPIGRPLFGFNAYAETRERCCADLRTALGPNAYQRAYKLGQRLNADEALALALGEAPAAPSGRDFEPLTPRESEVARLVARGMTNRELAHALVVSQRTVESHVQRILVKLGFTSRTQIARWVNESASAQALRR
jgi:predicted ATPase/DNA-binding CsgD family transcriptional regulator